MIDTAHSQPVELPLQRINALGLSYGREDSFKLTHRQLFADRVLIGIAELASRLLHLGVKWLASHPGRFEKARDTRFPRLSAAGPCAAWLA